MLSGSGSSVLVLTSNNWTGPRTGLELPDLRRLTVTRRAHVTVGDDVGRCWFAHGTRP